MDHRQLAEGYRARLKAAESRIFDLECQIADGEKGPANVKIENHGVSSQQGDVRALVAQIQELQSDVDVYNRWLDELKDATGLSAPDVVMALREMREKTATAQRQMEAAKSTEASLRSANTALVQELHDTKASLLAANPSLMHQLNTVQATEAQIRAANASLTQQMGNAKVTEASLHDKIFIQTQQLENARSIEYSLRTQVKNLEVTVEKAKKNQESAESKRDKAIQLAKKHEVALWREKNLQNLPLPTGVPSTSTPFGKQPGYPSEDNVEDRNKATTAAPQMPAKGSGVMNNVATSPVTPSPYPPAGTKRSHEDSDDQGCYDMDHRQLAAKYASQLNDASRRITDLETAVADSQELAAKAKADHRTTVAEVAQTQKQVTEPDIFSSSDKAHDATLTSQFGYLRRADRSTSKSLWETEQDRDTLKERLDEANKISRQKMAAHDYLMKGLQQKLDREKKRRQAHA
ncbi:hypothetical protein LTR53_005942 [Teratosphaeriaceae sp. CCFEE 6253]|nr:hypothetical protein LTR53_005942 [Teratosphaeriaceae sp. CCFEE 6253]